MIEGYITARKQLRKLLNSIVGYGLFYEIDSMVDRSPRYCDVKPGMERAMRYFAETIVVYSNNVEITPIGYINLNYGFDPILTGITNSATMQAILNSFES